MAAAPPRARAAPAGTRVRARYAYPGIAVAWRWASSAPAFAHQPPAAAVGGYSAGFFALVGLGLWARHRASGAALPAPIDGRRHRGRARYRARVAVAAAVLIAYAVAAIVVPTHLGFTHAVPVGARWWLLPVVVACVALFLLGAERLAAGSPWRLPLVLARDRGRDPRRDPGRASGRASSCSCCRCWWSARPGTRRGRWSCAAGRRPLWLAAVVGAVVVGWPIATSMPLGTG